MTSRALQCFTLLEGEKWRGHGLVLWFHKVASIFYQILYQAKIVVWSGMSAPPSGATGDSLVPPTSDASTCSLTFVSRSRKFALSQWWFWVESPLRNWQQDDNFRHWDLATPWKTKQTIWWRHIDTWHKSNWCIHTRHKSKKHITR